MSLVLLLGVLSGVARGVCGGTNQEGMNCLKCLDDNAEGNVTCYFCWQGNRCYDRIPLDCPESDLVQTRTQKCVEELGGDSKQSVRFAIGFSVLGVAIVIDLTVRILGRKAARDEYNHL
jgi:hypothetical protein